MLKRNGQVASRDDQLSLFDFARSRGQTNLSDAIRTDGREPLAGVPAEDGAGIGGEGHLDGSFIRGTGANDPRNGSADPEIGNGAEADPGRSEQTLPKRRATLALLTFARNSLQLQIRGKRFL
jgi:hypothetical protein